MPADAEPVEPTSGHKTPRWSRVMLKLSGEAFAGESGSGLDGDVIKHLAAEIIEAKSTFDVDIAVVVGGGNICRLLAGERVGTIVS